MGTVSNLQHRSSPYSSCRIVDDTLDSLFIIRIRHQPEIGYDVLDFLALVETQSAIDAIRNTLLSELLLEAAALGIGTVENGKITILAAILAPDTLHVLRNNHRLFLVAVSRLIQNLLALRILAEHILRNLVAVMLDQTVSRLNDSLGRAVVLFQFEETRIVTIFCWKISSERQYIFDISSPKTINTLRIISYSTYSFLFHCIIEQRKYFFLNIICILILIYHYVLKNSTILFQYIISFYKKSISMN